MHTRLLAVGLLLIVVYGIYLDGGKAWSAHKDYRHLVSSHFDAPGWDEIFCVEMNSWIWGTELEYQYTSTYTQLIIDVVNRPGEGWSYRPDSRIKILGLWNYSRGRWASCKELDPTYRANHVDIEVFIEWNAPQATCPYTFYVMAIWAGGCAEGHPSYYIPNAHPPATNLLDWGKYGIGFRNDKLDAGQVGSQAVYEIINHEFGHLWGLADPQQFCPNDPYTAPNQVGSVMHSIGYICNGPWKPTYLDTDSVAGQLNPPPTLNFSAPFLGFPTPTPAPGQPPPTATRTPTPTRTPTQMPTWTPTPKPVADLDLWMQPRAYPTDAVAAGSSLVYDIKFRNIGPASATNVVVSAPLPIGLEYMAVGTYFAPGFSCNYVSIDRNVVCQKASLAPTTQWIWLQLQVRITLQQTHNLTATIQANPSTDDPPGNNQGTVGITGIEMNCSPRPQINVTAVPNGDGRLRATVSTDNPSGTTNRLERLAFSEFMNAVVDIGGVTLTAGNQVHTLGLNQDSATFYVRRINPGPATVLLHVMDHCATSWETFVGGGASAF